MQPWEQKSSLEAEQNSLDCWTLLEWCNRSQEIHSTPRATPVAELGEYPTLPIPEFTPCPLQKPFPGGRRCWWFSLQSKSWAKVPSSGLSGFSMDAELSW